MSLLLTATLLTSYSGFSRVGASPSTAAGIASSLLTAKLLLSVASSDTDGSFVCSRLLAGRVT